GLPERRTARPPDRVPADLVPQAPQPVLVGPRAARCREVLEATCAQQGWVIRALAVQADHMHRWVRGWPSESAAEVIKECKEGSTSFTLRAEVHQLRMEFAPLRMLPSRWTRRYFASTPATMRHDTIERSIAAQPGKPPGHGTQDLPGAAAPAARPRKSRRQARCAGAA